MILQPDDKIIVFGHDNMALDPGFILVRLTADGLADGPFAAFSRGSSTHLRAVSSSATDVALTPDGSIVAVGTSFGSSQPDTPAPAFAWAIYGPDGRVQSDFLGGPDAEDPVIPIVGQPAATEVEIRDDGKILVAAQSPELGVALARYTADFQLDTGFGQGGVVPVTGAPESQSPVPRLRMLLQPDGKVIIAVGGSGARIIRFDPDGRPDGSFGNDGVVTLGDAGDPALVQPRQGGLVVAELSSDVLTLSRYLTD
jgi:uncharacterized delta-60 repeat protein